MSDKKPFKETIVAQVGKSLLKGVTRSIPVVGDVVENITSEDGGKGNVDYRKLATQVIRIITFGVLVWQFVKGNIPLDQILNF